MSGVEQPASLLSLVYSRRAIVGFNGTDLDALLQQSRTSNVSSQVTGMLLFNDHRFLQLLEGPEQAVRDKMQHILDDARHYDVTVLLEEHVSDRQFPDWTMGYASQQIRSRTLAVQAVTSTSAQPCGPPAAPRWWRLILASVNRRRC